MKKAPRRDEGDENDKDQAGERMIDQSSGTGCAGREFKNFKFLSTLEML